MSQRKGGSETADDRLNRVRDVSHLGLGSYARVAVCILLIVLAGCTAGVPISQETETKKVCIEDDGPPPRCLVEEHPPDLLVSSHSETPVTVSVRITRNDSAVVFSRNTTLGGYHDSTVTWEDVMDSPGFYVINATTDAGASDSLNQTVGKRWDGKDPVAGWILEISEGGDVDVRRHATHYFH